MSLRKVQAILCSSVFVFKLMLDDVLLRLMFIKFQVFCVLVL